MAAGGWDFPALEEHWQTGVSAVETRGWRSGGTRRVSVSHLFSVGERGDLREGVERQSLPDAGGVRDNRHKLECREFPLVIRKLFFHHEGGQNWNRFTREAQA